MLVVESNGYAEKYKRFYFKDIQALTIRKTKAGLIRWIVMGVGILFFAVVALATIPNDEAAPWICGSLAFLLLIIAVCDAIPGTTAACTMRTAVQVEALPSLNRVRRARKVLERLKPMIASAQGTMTPEEVEAQIQARFTYMPVNPAMVVSPPAAAADEIPPKIGP